jgi:hypothetical protein
LNKSTTATEKVCAVGWWCSAIKCGIGIIKSRPLYKVLSLKRQKKLLCEFGSKQAFFLKMHLSSMINVEHMNPPEGGIIMVMLISSCCCHLGFL